MSKITTVYCEGVAGSHDYDIINKLAADLTIRIEPIGSKKGAGSAIQVYEKLVVRSDLYLFFRDRDFDEAVPDTARLTKKGTYTFFSHRTTIENYLFDIPVFFSFVETNGMCEKYQLRNQSDVKKLFIKAAKNIKYYQASRHTLGFLRTDKTSFNTTWTGGSGILPEVLEDESCMTNGIAQILEAKVHTENWNEVYFRYKYKEFLEIFNEHFFDNLTFLIWFQGKDFATSLKKELHDFPLKSYYNYAKSNFNFTLFPDLVEFHDILRENQ